MLTRAAPPNRPFFCLSTFLNLYGLLNSMNMLGRIQMIPDHCVEASLSHMRTEAKDEVFQNGAKPTIVIWGVLCSPAPYCCVPGAGCKTRLGSKIERLTPISLHCDWCAGLCHCAPVRAPFNRMGPHPGRRVPNPLTRPYYQHPNPLTHDMEAV